MIEDGMPAPEIIASVETNSATRTLISVDEEGEGTIYWTPADQINIFYGTTSTLYTSQNTENATTAVFLTSAIIGSTESASTNIWGLYPYDEDAVCSGTTVTTTLPAAQYGVPGTFDDDLYITLAHSTSNALKFFNVCGGIKFSLSREDITSVSFRGNNNEDIAGDISLTFENDLPKATVVNGVKEVTLTPKTGQTFAKDVNYYLILLPGTLAGGFTMTFTTSNGAVGTFNYTTTPITIKRSIFSKKAQLDTFATFADPEDDSRAVDLGLSVKWASFNLGATKAEEFGDYYAWAETSPYYYRNNDNSFNFSVNQQGYDWGTYQWISLGKENTNIKRYCPMKIPAGDYRWTGSGDPDDKTEFADYNYVDDAARANWQGEWRTPSEAEWSELLSNCSWEWKENYSETGINGYLVTGTKTGYTNQSIFLPAAGWYRKTYNDYQNWRGEYWSSSLYINRPDNAWYLGFSTGGNIYMQYTIRPSGGSIRPVLGNPVLVTSVHLNCYSVSLYEGDTFTLSANVSPLSIENQSVVWASSDPSVVSVNNGVLEAITEGSASITVSRDGKEATCEVTVSRNATSPEAVDLGLSVKWASFNIGANSPEDYGDYFAWGETSPKETYTPDNYLWYESGSWTSNNLVLTKYTSLPATLTLEDDAAHVNWGGSWRMPTFTEQTELRTQCDWTYTSVNEVTGWRVSSRSNGNSIFLPDANSMWYNRYYSNSSRGVYLSSTLYGIEKAYTLDLIPDSGSSRDVYWSFVLRFEGVPIRAVQD